MYFPIIIFSFFPFVNFSARIFQCSFPNFVSFLSPYRFSSFSFSLSLSLSLSLSTHHRLSVSPFHSFSLRSDLLINARYLTFQCALKGVLQDTYIHAHDETHFSYRDGADSHKSNFSYFGGFGALEGTQQTKNLLHYLTRVSKGLIEMSYTITKCVSASELSGWRPLVIPFVALAKKGKKMRKGGRKGHDAADALTSDAASTSPTAAADRANGSIGEER